MSSVYAHLSSFPNSSRELRAVPYTKPVLFLMLCRAMLPLYYPVNTDAAGNCLRYPGVRIKRTLRNNVTDA